MAAAAWKGAMAMGLFFGSASLFAAALPLVLGSNAIEQDGGLVVGILGHEFAAKGFGENGAIELA